MKRLAQLQAEREAEARGERVAGHPARSFSSIQKDSQDLPLEESDFAYMTRKFDLQHIGNRRFMFNPRTGKFLIGDSQGVGSGKGVRKSHAEEFYDVTGSNQGYDDFFI